MNEIHVNTDNSSKYKISSPKESEFNFSIEKKENENNYINDASQEFINKKIVDLSFLDIINNDSIDNHINSNNINKNTNSNCDSISNLSTDYNTIKSGKSNSLNMKYNNNIYHNKIMMLNKSSMNYYHQKALKNIFIYNYIQNNNPMFVNKNFINYN